MNRMLSKFISSCSIRQLGSGTILSRRFSSEVNALTMGGLPSNLKLDDPDILNEPTPKVVVPPELFYFPQLNVKKSIKVAVFNSPGTFQSEEVPLDPRIFGVALRKDIVHEVIRYQRAKSRQPKKTKRMSEIRGSNKKPWPQKKQGKAQVGHRRNSVWRGGQKAHGPVLRDYSIGMNRKVRAMGLMISLAAKLHENNLVVVDNFECQVCNFYCTRVPFFSHEHE